MSAKNKTRLFWILPGALVASWLTVQTLSASPGSSPAPLPAASVVTIDPGPNDASLQHLIGQFADSARAQRRPAGR
jgi:hypothetical protein